VCLCVCERERERESEFLRVWSEPCAFVLVFVSMARMVRKRGGGREREGSREKEISFHIFVYVCVHV